jgi:hypothetical protein
VWLWLAVVKVIEFHAVVWHTGYNVGSPGSSRQAKEGEISLIIHLSQTARKAKLHANSSHSMDYIGRYNPLDSSLAELTVTTSIDAEHVTLAEVMAYVCRLARAIRVLLCLHCDRPESG